MVLVPVDILGPSANQNFLRVRVVRPDLTWQEVLVLKALVVDGKVQARWIQESETQVLVELPTAGIDVRLWVVK